MIKQRTRSHKNQTQLLSLTTTTTAVIEDAPLPPPMMRTDIVVVITPTGSPVHKKRKFVFPASSTTNSSCSGITPPKQVVFGPNIIYRIETIEELTRDEKDACWYLPSELEAMKHAAKYLFRKRILLDDREEQTTTPRDDNDTQIKCDDNDDEDSLRGMGTYHPVRVRYSKKYCQKVVEAYRKMRHHVQRVQSPSFLAEEMENGTSVAAVVAAVAAWNGEAHIAALATRWSIKNVQRALTRGRNDYNIVYGS